jgi:hypothetical protein
VQIKANKSWQKREKERKDGARNSIVEARRNVLKHAEAQ